MDELAIPEDWLTDLRGSLLAWFDEHHRKLPFRGIDDPYGIWVSEIMLQQTQVQTVVDYWTRWMERFPDLETLALADEEEVLRLWAGLGYYRRARLLHKAAKIMAEEGVPQTHEGWKALPGVGDYTAGAVTSIAFGVVEPALDGNVQRVLARLLEDSREIGSSAMVKEQRAIALSLVEPDRPGDFNQAMMELGARVCTPKKPVCEECPLQTWCLAYANQTQNSLPTPKRRKAPRTETQDVHVIFNRDSQVLMRRGNDSLLKGLWEFCGSSEGDLVVVGEVQHVFSHIRMTYRVFCGLSNQSDGGDWIAPEEVEGLGISKAIEKIWRLVLSDMRVRNMVNLPRP